MDQSFDSIKHLNQLGYMLSVDFNPDHTCAVSILKNTDRDHWSCVGMGTADTLLDAIEEARVRANIDE